MSAYRADLFANCHIIERCSTNSVLTFAIRVLTTPLAAPTSPTPTAKKYDQNNHGKTVSLIAFIYLFILIFIFIHYFSVKNISIIPCQDPDSKYYQETWYPVKNTSLLQPIFKANIAVYWMINYLPLPCKHSEVTSCLSDHLDHQHGHLYVTPKNQRAKSITR